MRRNAERLLAIALLMGCGGEPIDGDATAATEPRPLEAAATEVTGANAAELKDLAALRRVTAPFHRFENAKAAGWSTGITGCMTDPAGSGGMGFHYGNPALIDGSVRADEPELLLYEPEKNGRMRLVAVEYIVPLSAWKSTSPPRLFGHDFKVNEAFQIWALHAWVWESNPRGMYADWNLRVTCENATDAQAMSHD